MDEGRPLYHLARHFAEFFAAALHLILFIRQIYPSETFTRKRKYGCITWWSSSTLLCEYITEISSSIQELIHKKLLSKINVLIFDHHGGSCDTHQKDSGQSGYTLIEKFVFDFQNADSFWFAPSIFESPSEPAETSAGTSIRTKEDLQLATHNSDLFLYEVFRDSLVKLHFTDLLLHPKNKPRGSVSFHIQIESHYNLMNASACMGTSLPPPDPTAVAHLQFNWLPSKPLYLEQLNIESQSSSTYGNYKANIRRSSNHMAHTMGQSVEENCQSVPLRVEDTEDLDGLNSNDRYKRILKTIHVRFLPSRKIVNIFQLSVEERARSEPTDDQAMKTEGGADSAATTGANAREVLPHVEMRGRPAAPLFRPQAQVYSAENPGGVKIELNEDDANVYLSMLDDLMMN